MELITRYPESAACQNAYYNLACIESIRRNTEPALNALEQAVRLGFTDHEWLLEDGDLEPLRSHPRFQQIVSLARTGLLEDLGEGWLAKLTPFLPPRSRLFELPLEQQREILMQAGAQLTDAEQQRLLEMAPETLRESLAATLIEANATSCRRGLLARFNVGP